MKLPLAIAAAAALLVLAPASADAAGSAGIGVGFFGHGRDGALGLALDFSGGMEVAQRLHVNIAGQLAFCDFERTAAAAQLGIELAKWTTGAFGPLTDWWTKPADEWLPFRLMAAMFGYMFLLATYGVSGMLIIMSPFFSFTYGVLGPTVSYHFGSDKVDAFAELGVGGMLSASSLRAFTGAGPMGGVGVALGDVLISARVLWVPAFAQSEGVAGAYTTSFTVGYAFGR